MCGAPANGDLTLRDVNAGCSCCSTATSTETTAASEESEIFLVAGMTCGHCVASVREELSEIAGVKAVEVELVAGGASRVTVSSETPVDPAAVDAAIREAGYEPVIR